MYPTFLIAESLSHGLSASRVLGIGIWMGLAILTVCLIVLMRTRWGQAQPLSKCVALSIFAHVLLFTYAYGTRLIFDPLPRQNEEVLRLAIVSDHDQSRPASTEPRPWEQLASDFQISPDLVSPSPPSVAVESPPTEAVTQPEFTALPQYDVLVDSPVERPLPDAPPSIAVQTSAPAPSAVQPETPELVEINEPAALVPVSAPLSRLALDDSPPPAPAPSSASDPLDDLLQQSTLQQLTDADVDAQIAEARPSSVDVTAAASNRELLHEIERSESETSDGSELSGAVSAAPQEPGQFNELPSSTRRLGDGQPMPRVYHLRMARDRLNLIQRNGATAESERAVEAALRWLAANQEADGSWDAARFGAGRETKTLGHDRQHAGIDADTGITGLALLAFLSAGHTHFEGEYRRTVQHGLEFLLSQQARDGNLAGRARLFARMYCHGMATLAISEAYAMTGDYRMRPYAEQAVQYTIDAQDPRSGGWRYQPADQGDMSQFGWQVMSLKSAELAGLPIPGETRSGMLRFLRSVSKGEHGGLAAYRATERPSHTMTAESLACRFLLGVHQETRAVDEAIEYLMQDVPSTGKANLYDWYYATLALFQTDDAQWPRWNEALQRELLSRQRNDGELAGSWDPDTVWGGYGGRVYSTALATLCLEVYYRYLPVYE